MENLHKPEFDTPNIKASEAVLIVQSRTVINCPAAIVFRSLRNTDTWKDWNRFVPRVTIWHQPSELDDISPQEVSELVRNTSLTGTFYSDLTDGGIGGAKRPKSPDDVPPPRFRLNSMDSRMSSQSSQGGQPGPLDALAALEKPIETNGAAPRTSISSKNGSTKSAAQKFQEAQESRRASIANGETPAPITNSVASGASHRASSAVPSGKRLSTSSDAAVKRAHQKTHAALITIVGEPNVRILIGTKLTFHCRMKPDKPRELQETTIAVTDIARPDDPLTEHDTTALTRSKTHNLDRAGAYRVVWQSDSEGASALNLSGILSGTKVPKYMLFAERVHEITNTTDGAGNEICVYKTWECMKGPLAKVVKKKHGAHLQKMFEIWGSGLKDFCEGLWAPKIDRRDFSISE